jgi:hypothetical protein
VRYRPELARRICERVASGESLRAVCEDADMPHRATVLAWAARLPRFSAELAQARSAAGWRSALGGGLSTWCVGTAEEIFARLCGGESLTRICEDPAMPGVATVYAWRKARPEFDAAMRLAREAQAERLCDQGLEIAHAVTPATAHATRVRLWQLRWTAAGLCPQRFGRLKALAAEDAPERAPLTVIVKRFTDAPDPYLDGRGVDRPGPDGARLEAPGGSGDDGEWV